MGSFFAELRRRHIYRIGAGYVVVAWAIAQFIDFLSQVFALPDWIAQPVAIILAVGLPITLVVAWLIEGRVREAETSNTSAPTSRTDWFLAGGLALVLILITYQQVTLNIRSGTLSDSIDASIAVLPFNNLGSDPNNAAFVDGVHGELLTQLYKIGSLKVISRTSVMEYRDTPKNIRQIGEELGAANILEGDVQRSDDLIRINVQLINAETDEQLWAEAYDQAITVENLLAIQREMATAIASALQATISPEEIGRINEIPTQNTQAYEFYLEGNEHFYNRLGPRRGAVAAVESYERAVAEDSQFALAWAALSRAYIFTYWRADEPTERRRMQAYSAAERALQLAPGMPEAHLALGDYHYYSSRDYARALAEYEIAQRGMPGEASVIEQRGYIFRRLGLWDLTLETLSEALSLDPRNQNILGNLATTNLNMRNYEVAEQIAERVASLVGERPFSKAVISLQRDGDSSTAIADLRDTSLEFFGDYDLLRWQAYLYERDYDAAHEVLAGWLGDAVDDERLDRINSANTTAMTKASLYGITYQLNGQSDEARSQFQQARAQLEEYLETTDETGDRAISYIALGEALAGLGEDAEAARAAHYAMELVPVTSDALVGRSIQLDAAIRVFVPAGDHDSALAALDNYLGNIGGTWTIEGLLPDPRLDPIRDDPRFVALVDKYRRQ